MRQSYDSVTETELTIKCGLIHYWPDRPYFRPLILFSVLQFVIIRPITAAIEVALDQKNMVRHPYGLIGLSLKGRIAERSRPSSAHLMPFLLSWRSMGCGCSNICSSQNCGTGSLCGNVFRSSFLLESCCFNARFRVRQFRWKLTDSLRH